MKSKLLIALALFFSSTVFAQSSGEKKAVERAILNYVEAFYEADTTKAYESVAPYLAKRGYYMRNGAEAEATMSFEQLVRLSQRWKNTKNITAASPKKITVFDVLDKIATAKVEAEWGIDYFHLAKVAGKWTIINVLWQDYRPARAAAN
jgi:hypothetical protein